MWSLNSSITYQLKYISSLTGEMCTADKFVKLETPEQMSSEILEEPSLIPITNNFWLIINIKIIFDITDNEKN